MIEITGMEGGGRARVREPVAVAAGASAPGPRTHAIRFDGHVVVRSVAELVVRAGAPGRVVVPLRLDEGDGVIETDIREQRSSGPTSEAEQICHIVEDDSPDRARCGKDVTGYPWNPPWPMWVVCVDLYEQGRGDK